jgi:DNA-binding NtrC family response regulator
VRKGQFREDLYYRVHVVQIEVPPLRDRREDIRPLIAHMAGKTGEVLTFSEAAMHLLEAYRWPGNVRELQNVIEQLASLVHNRAVEPADLPMAIASRSHGPVEVLHDRRRTIVNELYEGLTSGELHFWDDVHRLFTDRDLTRADLRHLIRKGLIASSGSYRGLLRLFRMTQDDYKTLLNFLAAHDCRVDSRRFRGDTRQADSEPVTRSRVASRS